MNVIQKHILSIALILTLFAIGSTGLVSLTEVSTRDKIADNERQALLKAIHALLPKERYDNDILSDTLQLPENPLTHSAGSTVYRARLGEQPVAVIFSTVAPNGYNGNITLLVGIYHDGRIAGVRVINHKETPGLGDKIDIRKSDWIEQFAGLSLDNPKPQNWLVKKDGGQFDQFTGATITPRAIIQAIKNALHYFEQQRDWLFKPHHD